MSIIHEDITDIDIGMGTLRRSFTNRMIGEGDISGNRFGVRAFRNGEEVDLTGVTTVGYFIRANGTTEVINGDRSGNKCWVDLPLACYAVEGNFQLSIKLIGGGVTATARIVDGTVVDTVLGTINDPGSVIPDLSSFSTLVARAEAAADTIDGISITNTLIEGTRYRINVATS